jgi:hypothetical protein
LTSVDGLNILERMNQRAQGFVGRIPMRLTQVLFMASTAGMLLLSSSASAQSTSGQKVDAKILYVGHPGSDREKEFVDFLGQHFQEVKATDLTRFGEPQAQGFDVVLLDYDGDGFKAPRPALSSNYRKATVTIGVMGGLLSGQLGLKTGYM